MHDTNLHHLLAPQDLSRHIADDHNVRPADVTQYAKPTRVRRYLTRHGIESTNDVQLDALLVWHEKTHAYATSRTPAQRRAEQRTTVQTLRPVEMN